MDIRLAIVEDTLSIREAMKMIATFTPGFECVAVYSNSEDAIAELPKICPDVVLMDIGLPGMNGIECTKILKRNCEKTQYLICTVFEDDDNIFEALKAGATGYILKNTAPAQILNAVRELHEGGAPMSGSIARRVIAQMQKKNEVSKEIESLSERENEILHLLAKGFRYKEIGDQLSISLSTVRTHIHHIYEKLQVQSRTDALNKAFSRNQ